MTYLELYENATRQLEKSEITLGEYEEMVKPLDREVKAIEQEPCEDAVSREKVWYIMTGGKYADESCEQFIDRMVEKLNDLPPVTPTRKKGKWERGYSFPDGEYVKCTVCGEIIKCIYPMHFCPHCGADMRGTENETN